MVYCIYRFGDTMGRPAGAFLELGLFPRLDGWQGRIGVYMPLLFYVYHPRDTLDMLTAGWNKFLVMEV